jgi:hypothetical protein
MEAFAAAVAAIAIIVGGVLLVAFIFYCLVRISTAADVRLLPKWAWAVLVVCVNPLGGVAFLLSQHLPVARHARS